MKNIMLIEDNVDCQLLVKRALDHSFNVHCFSDFQSAKNEIMKHESSPWSAVILDRSLPDGEGIQLCQYISKMRLAPPVVVLSAKSELGEKVYGLNSGADDYVIKPFEPSELVARIQAIMRRSLTAEKEGRSLIYEDLELNLEEQTVKIKLASGEKLGVDLTPIEFKILLILVKNIDKKTSRDEIIRIVWDKINLSARNIDIHICRIRKKIASSQVTIKNKRGDGYYLSREAVAVEPESVLSTGIYKEEFANVGNSN
jgi:DNA-binding response OmpR family regulator